MRNHSIEDSKQIYGIDNWGDPYFDVNDAGNLVVRPTLGEPQSVDLKDTVDELVAKKVPLPILLRFPQLLASQVKSICESFARAIEEYDYRNVYSPVFPVKVNQRREVVQELLRAGRKYRLGLEAGSKSEVLISMAQDVAPESLLVCNGFKDPAYLEVASLAARVGRKVVVVLEKPFEVRDLMKLAPKLAEVPMLGFRVRLYSRGSGRWERSSGATSKFGLTTGEILQGIELLRPPRRGDRFR